MDDAGSPPPSSVDPRSGFCAATKIFHSLRPPAPLPPPSQPVSVTSYVFSLLPYSSGSPSSPALINATRGGASLSYPELLSRVRALAASLQSRVGLSKGDVAFVLAPADLEVPVLYYALLAIGAVVSPSNPASTAQEISHQFQLTSPSVAFATSAVAHKIPRDVKTVILYSDQFRALLEHDASDASPSLPAAAVRQSDPAAILYSSGTTGRVKAVVLSHLNFIALISHYKVSRVEERESPSVLLLTVPLFHVFGFTMLLRATALGQTMVLMERFDFAAMLGAVERYRVTFMPVSPPLIVAMLKSDVVGRHDLSSLEVVGCGGAPLGSEVAERFTARFPHIQISQGYGLTESAGGATATMGPEEHRAYGSAGRLACNTEAKIVDPSTGQALPPGQQGELWLRSPYNMIGYLGDNEATASTLDSEGWLKTGDLCYFNEDGFLFVVDRLKELIKYKAYQVPPAELERILLSHPEIADAAVIPFPDEEAGQIPMAFVVRRPRSSLSGDQVIEFVARQVSPYKKVRRVSFIESIPKSAAGKILRRELVNHAILASASKL